MVEAFQVMQDRITRSRLAGDPPDVMINPRLGRTNLFDFHRANDTIALGAEAVLPLPFGTVVPDAQGNVVMPATTIPQNSTGLPSTRRARSR